MIYDNRPLSNYCVGKFTPRPDGLHTLGYLYGTSAVLWVGHCQGLAAGIILWPLRVRVYSPYVLNIRIKEEAHATATPEL